MKATSPTGKSSDSVLNWQKLLSCTEISWKEIKYFHFKLSLWNILKISNLIHVYVMYNYIIEQMPNTIVNMMSQKKKRHIHLYTPMSLVYSIYKSLYLDCGLIHKGDRTLWKLLLKGDNSMGSTSIPFNKKIFNFQIMGVEFADYLHK